MSTTSQHQIKEVPIMPMIKPEDKLVEVGLEVFGGYAMIYANDCPLKQAPETLNTHRMDVPINERPRMAHSGVGVPSGSPLVALEFVGAKEFGVSADNHVEHLRKRNCLYVGDYTGGHVPAAFLDSEDDSFAGSPATSLAASAPTADVGLIGFDDASELIFELIPWLHGDPYLHRHSPGCFVGDSEGSFELFGTDAFLRFNHQPNGDKPLLKRSSGAMEDGSSSNRELMSAILAFPYLAFFDAVGTGASAFWANDTIGPAHLGEEYLALVLGGESFLKFENVHVNLLWKEYSTNSVLSQRDKALKLRQAGSRSVAIAATPSVAQGVVSPTAMLEVS